MPVLVSPLKTPARLEELAHSWVRKGTGLSGKVGKKKGHSVGQVILGEVGPTKPSL